MAVRTSVILSFGRLYGAALVASASASPLRLRTPAPAPRNVLRVLAMLNPLSGFAGSAVV
jgi:hypothetical protein